MLFEKLFGLVESGLGVKVVPDTSKEFPDALAFRACAEFFFCLLPRGGQGSHPAFVLGDFLQGSEKSEDGCFCSNIGPDFFYGIDMAFDRELEEQPGIIPAGFDRLYESSEEAGINFYKLRLRSRRAFPPEVQLRHTVPADRTQQLSGDLFHFRGLDSLAQDGCPSLCREGPQPAIRHRCNHLAVVE